MRRRTFLHSAAGATGAALLAQTGAGTARAEAAEPSAWTVRAPAAHAGAPEASVTHAAADGTLAISVSRGTTTVLAPSPLGIVTEQADLSKELRFVGRTSRVVVERYDTTVGKRLRRFAAMTEARFRFVGTGGARLELLVRVSADGVAYRYVLPADYGAVTGEASVFNVPPGASAWLARARRDYENAFVEYTAASAPAADFQVPALFEVDGTYLLLAESALSGSYSGPRLLHDAGTGAYHVDVSSWDPAIAVDGPLATPWRVLVVGDLATVTRSTLVDDVAPASKLAGDSRWIKPGPAMWTWLAGGRSAQQSLERQQGFVDYAAARGWPYLLVDAGWYDDPETGERAWTDRVPEFTWIPALVDHARARDVGVMVWLRFSDFDTAAKRAERFGLLEQWGVKGVKIDFLDSESQERLRWYDETLADLAAHRLMVDFHGSTVPKGIHRTWPHVLTMEGVNGAEKSNQTTAHVTTLPFTRNLIGSMDYTPEAFQKDGRPTSDAYELGLSVVFESGLQNFAGSPEAYDARPEARWFLEQVPSVWDETRLLSGRPADHVVMARRRGERWFLGGGVAGDARTLQAPLDIGPGRWEVEVIRDGEAGEGLVREQRVMDAGDPLSVPVPASGGFAGIARRWTPGVRS